MKKRILSLVIIMCMILNVFIIAQPITGYSTAIDYSSRDRIPAGDSCAYTIRTDTDGHSYVYIDDYSSTKETVILPNFISGYPVESMKNTALVECRNAKYIIYPDYIRYVGGTYHSAVKVIYLPATTKQIVHAAFYGGSSMEIYYEGSSSQWESVQKNIDYNAGIANANVHYNSSPMVGEIQLPREIKIDKNRKSKINISFLPQKSVDKNVTWLSTNPDIVEVDENGYVTGKSEGTAYILATASTGYARAACIVEVVDASNDYNNYYGYNFGNEDINFGYDNNYSIPYRRYIQAGVPETIALEISERKWGGNCFGMSLSSMLFFKNILKEERYDFDDFDAKFPIELEAPINDDISDFKLRGMIELFQVSQFRNAFTRISFANESSTYMTNLIKSELDSGNPVALGIKCKHGGHRVVIHSYTKSQNTYTFHIYDCSGFVSDLIYTWDSGTEIWKFEYDNSYHEYTLNNIITYDEILEHYNDIYNKSINNAAGFFSLSSEPTYTYIIRPVEDLTITNSAGQTTQIIDGEAIGDIEDITVIPDEVLAENPKYTIIAPTDSYTITGTSDEEVTTAIADDYLAVEVTSKSSTPVTVSEDLYKVSVSTNADDVYLVKYAAYNDIFDTTTLTGTASGNLSAELTENNINVSGAKSINVSSSISDSFTQVESEIADGETASIVYSTDENDNTTIQIISGENELTEAAALPERTKMPTPIYDLESGTYESGQTLTFTCDDETLIYYTTDGSIPSSENGTLYTLPIEINKSITINAISTRPGYTDSDIIELNYELPTVGAPRADYSSGEYTKAISVNLFAEDGAQIYYTTDGSDPYENGMLFASSIVITEDTTISAYAIKNGCISEISTYEYTLAPEYPFHITNTLANQDNEIISLENIAELSKVKLTIQNLTDTTQSGTIIAAFIDKNNRIIGVNCAEIEIDDGTQDIELNIKKDVSATDTIKLYIWDGFEKCIPISDVLTFKLY